MNIKEARCVAGMVVHALADYCDQIVIGGSIRRGKPEVKDVEIVYVSKMEVVQEDMFWNEDIPLVDGQIIDLVKSGFWDWDRIVPRNGDKYKRMIFNPGGIMVELFRAVPENWGLILALRTGDAGFNKLLVTPETQGGAMPRGMRMDGGFLWKLGERLESATETEFFDQLGLTWIKPEHRDVDTLRMMLRARNFRAVPTLMGEEWLEG